MKKNDYVEFRRVPTKLADSPKPIYGTIKTMLSKDKAIVKPRYKRFTIVVKLSDLSVVSYDDFNKKQQKPMVIKSKVSTIIIDNPIGERVEASGAKTTVRFCEDIEAGRTCKPRTYETYSKPATDVDRERVLESLKEHLEHEAKGGLLIAYATASIILATIITVIYFYFKA